MRFPLCLLSFILFLSGSLADLCYQCTGIRSNDESPPNNCIGGSFVNNALPDSVKIMECGPSIGCLRSEVTIEAIGFASITRGCSNPMFAPDKCFDPKDVITSSFKIDGLQEGMSIEGVNQKTCACQGDYCNGAKSLNAKQAIVAVVAGLTIILMQH